MTHYLPSRIHRWAGIPQNLSKSYCHNRRIHPAVLQFQDQEVICTWALLGRPHVRISRPPNILWLQFLLDSKSKKKIPNLTIDLIEVCPNHTLMFAHENQYCDCGFPWFKLNSSFGILLNIFRVSQSSSRVVFPATTSY